MTDYLRVCSPVEIPGDRWEFRDHVVAGEGVFPAAGYLELMRERFARDGRVSVRDVHWRRPLRIADTLVLEQGDDGDFHRCQFGDWCTARVAVEAHGAAAAAASAAPGGDATDAIAREMDSEAIYEGFESAGISYRNAFRSLVRLWVAGETVTGFVDLPAGGHGDLCGYDAAIQCALMHSFVTCERNHTRVPFSLGELHIEVALPRQFVVKAVRTRQAPDGRSAAYDVLLLSHGGEQLASARDLVIRDYSLPVADALDIRIAATFTSEPLADPLQRSLTAASLRPRLGFAPYGQLLPQLLPGSTALMTAGSGVNVLLLRAEDLAGNAPAAAARATIDADAFAPHKSCVLPSGQRIAHLNSYETDYLYREIFEERVYDSHGIVVRDGDTVVDIGANIGMFALSVVEKYPGCRVFAFEPSAAVFEVLDANARLHGAGRIVTARCGVWSRSGAQKFTYYPGSSVFSGFRADPDRDAQALRATISNALEAKGLDATRCGELTRRFMDQRLTREEHECPVRSLSDLVAEHDIRQIDLLKIDAEGSELEILDGISEHDWERIRQIVVEVHELAGIECAAIAARLAAMGFQVQVREERALAGSGLKNVYATRAGVQPPPLPAELRRNLADFAACVRHFSEATRVPCVVGVTPPTPGAGVWRHEAAVAQLAEQLHDSANVHFVSFTDCGESLLADYHDETRERTAGIPYKPACFEFMAATLAGIIAGVVAGPRKVIALDADGTLWDGICAEDKLEDLRVNRGLQEFIRQRAREGLLLCLVSKNSPDDVRAVFESHPAMILQWSDFVAVRANWSPKSQNLASIAGELDLSLDSFVFLDDNPLECAEVRAHCPQVFTYCLPADPERVRALLERACVLRPRELTSEDLRRGQMYRENAAREQHRAGFESMRDYLDSLRLEVTEEPVAGDALARAAQLTARTNQFNIRKLKRTAQELQAQLQSGSRGFAVRVSDRFGDYGLAGLVIHRTAGLALQVDTFLLSCRVLGRGVEFDLARRLGRIALEQGLERVVISTVPDARNRPAVEFLAGLTAVSQRRHGDEFEFVFTPQYLMDVSFDPERRNVADTGAFHTQAALLPVSAEAPATPAVDSREVHPPAVGVARYVERVLRGIRDIPRHTLPGDVSFASLGIDSFSLVETLVRLEQDFGRLPSTLLFDHDSVDSLGSYLATHYPRRLQELLREVGDYMEAPAPVSAAEALPDDLAPAAGSDEWLSANQEAMWISHSTEQGALAYNVPLTITLHGEVDESRLRDSLALLIQRHEALRTHFLEREGGVYCRVETRPDFGMAVVDLRGAERRIQDARVQELMAAESRTGFDLAGGLPIRATLVHLKPRKHLLLLTLHHLASDAWSLRILFRDLAAIHENLRRGEAQDLPPPGRGYREFVRWERAQRDSGSERQSLAYWQKALAGAPALLRLPVDRTRPSPRGFASASLVFQIPRPVAQALRSLSVENDCSLYVTMLGAFSVLLHVYSGQRDFVFGSPAANRDLDGVRHTIGYFANVLPVRVRFDGAPTFLDVLAQIAAWNTATQQHRSLPFARLLELLEVCRSPQYAPLVQTIFGFQNTPIEAAAFLNADFSLLDRVTVESQFELAVEVQDERQELTFRIEYLTGLFDGDTIRGFAEHFVALLERLAADPELPIRQHCLLSEEQRDRLVGAPADAGVKPLHELIEEQARMRPGAIAVAQQGRALTFDELNQRANRVAGSLRERGVGPETRVGLCVESSPDRIIGALGILKAGGGYVPLDPDCPDMLLARLIEDSGTKILLADAGSVPALRSGLQTLAAPEGEEPALLVLDSGAECGQRLADPGVTASHLACVMHSLDETGELQGQLVTHRSLCNLIPQWARLSRGDVVTVDEADTPAQIPWWSRLLEGAEAPETTAYVLGAAGELLPAGPVGELYLGGPALPRGSLGSAARTAEYFVPNPHGGEPGARLYRTFQPARRRPDGELQLIDIAAQIAREQAGSPARQRIRLRLLESPAVTDAEVVGGGGVDSASPVLAYVVPARHSGADPSRLPAELRRWMGSGAYRGPLPDAVIVVESLPRRSDGSLDLAALPAGSPAALTAENGAARTGHERLLVELWQGHLEQTPIGIDDNYFALGGDSIRAIALVAAARQRGVGFSAKDLFAFPTIRSLAAQIDAGKLEAAEMEVAVPLSLLTAEEIARLERRFGRERLLDAYPLSRMQQGMVFHTTQQPGLALYLGLHLYRIDAPWDESLFRRAVQQVLERHRALRAFFSFEGERALQVILADRMPDIDIADAAHVDAAQAARDWLAAEKVRGIDLEGTLLRLSIRILSPDAFLFGSSKHHALIDGWSQEIFHSELFAAYHALRDSGVPKAFKPIPDQTHHLLLEERSVASAEQREYWSRKLSGAKAPWWTGGGKGNSVRLSRDLSRDESRRLSGLATTLGVQEKSLCCALYLAMVALMDGSDDSLGSSVINCRPEIPGGDKLVGIFLNTLPIRVDVRGKTWRELVAATDLQLREQHAYRHFPLAEIQHQTGLVFSGSIFNYLNFRLAAEAEDAHARPVKVGDWYETNTPFLFCADKETESGSFQLSLHLEPSIFGPELRERMAGYLDHALRQLLTDASAPVDRNALLGTAETERLLAAWNDTALDFDRERRIHDSFEAQALSQPDAIALVHEGSQLSYGELNQRANQLAHRLIAAGLGPEMRVGVCMERSLELVTTILAVLKAGACHVPMDPRYPRDRLDFIERDAGVALVLTGAHLQGLCDFPTTNPAPRAIATNLAYVIYTSGSTGRPKGVGIQHRSASSFLAWVQATNGRERLRSVLAGTSTCFDLSVYEIFGPLSLGGECVLIDDILSLDQSLAQERVQLLNTVPSAIRGLLQKQAIPPGVRTINLAGERLVPALVDELYALGTVRDVHDLYGPSEATTYSTQARRAPCGPETIGHPVANTAIYILRGGSLVPTGVPGEIFVGGTGLARGYLGRPGLTADRFVPDPFGAEAGGRLYRTGDLGRYLPDGSIEYLGRLDQQVKLRGYRIELGEIESELLNLGDWQDVAVVAQSTGRDNTHLVAYLVAKPSVSDGAVVAQDWHRVFDEELYRAAAARESAGHAEARNWFDGWISSYDRAPLPRHAMQAWADLAVARIETLAPREILEIGCGLGLLALRLLPGCDRYVGSDFSRSALAALEANVPADTKSRLQLHCCEARDFAAYQGRQFDAVVLNSVVQYFPDAAYLLDTIEGALRHLRPGGALFIGDVRNLDLLGAFATSLELARSGTPAERENLRGAVASRIAKENELLVSPRFFEQLKARFPAISHIELLPKYDASQQGIDNELFRYRYDVVLTVAGEPAPVEADAIEIDWRSHGFDLEQFRRELAAGPRRLRMTHVPDTRLSADLALFGRLQAGDVASVEPQRCPDGISLETYVCIAEEHGYRADVSLVGASPGEYHLYLRRPRDARLKSVAEQPADASDPASLVNDPMKLRRETELKSRARDILKQRLPEYMVPAAFVVLPKMPLNANGKTDRKALPAPDDQAFTRDVHVSPRSRRERALVEIWERVLNAGRIGIRDNFFALGGDSILSIQVVSQARARGFGLTTRAIFEHPTIESLALQMVDAVQAIPQGSAEGEPTLLPMQRIFFRDNPDAVNHYHQSLLVSVPEEFDAAFLRAFVAAAYQRHDALRLRFARRDAAWRGVYGPVTDALVAASIRECDLRGMDESQRADTLREVGRLTKEGFDISQGPLLRAVYFRAAEPRHSRVLLVIHHLVVDGVSWRILLGDLELAFAQWRRERVVRLAQKTHGIDVWARGLASRSREPALLPEKAFWLASLAGAAPALPAESVVPPAENVYGASEQVRVEVDAELTEQLLNGCHHAYRTRINDLLLSGLFLAVFKWTEQRHLRISLEGHGREELLEGIDVSQTVGWFTSLFPLNLRVPASWSPGAQHSLQTLILSVKEELRSLPHNGVGYGVLRHLAADVELLACEEPAGILFNYLGQVDSLFSGETAFAAAAGDTGSDLGPTLRRSHELAINGQVKNGQLVFDIDFHPMAHARETVERFGRHLQRSLLEIVTHCRLQQLGRFSPSDFPLAGLQQGEIDGLQQRYPRLTNCYAASGLQSGLIFHALMDEGANRGSYTVQVHFTLEAPIDVRRFRNAWERIAQQHECFRSAFTGLEREHLLQVVLEAVELPWTELDWRGKSEGECRAEFEALARADRERGFDFSVAPLMRFTLIRELDSAYRFLWTHHHSLLDGWSLGSVLGEVMGLYAGTPAKVAGRGVYKDYLASLRACDPLPARQFWTQQLKSVGRRAPLGLPVPVDARGGEARLKTGRLTARQTRALEALARRHQVTMNVVVVAAWSYLLSRYSGSDTVVLGQTVSGRDPSIPHVEDIVGMLVRTIPLCVEVEGGLEIGAWLNRLHARSVECERYSYYPLPDIQQCAGLSASENLFESLVVFENYPIDERLKDNYSVDGTAGGRSGGARESAAAGLPIGTLGSHETTHYALTLLAMPTPVLGFKLSYRPEQFSPAVIEQMMRQFTVILNGMASGQFATVAELPLFSEQDRLQSKCSGAVHAIPDHRGIHETIEAQVRSTPDAVAVIHAGQSLTYGELNARANRLARRLRTLGVGPDQRVALCAERGLDLVTGLLAVLKSGGACVTLDPNYPAERLRYMMDDAAPRVVLTQKKLDDVLPATAAARVMLEEEPGGDARDLDPAETGLAPRDLVYVIYTSGSTGRPKGTAMPHRAMLNLIDWHRRELPLDAGARVLQFAALSFDVAFQEILSTLGCGGTLVMLHEWQRRDPQALLELLGEQRVQRLFVPPLLLQSLAESSRGTAACALALRDVITAGEQLRVSSEIVEFLRRAPGCRLHNHYGPTETHVVTALTLSGDPGQWPVLPSIGSPIANTQIHILDGRDRPVPAGVAGEIHIGGANVARGYFERPEMSAERFVRDPFSGADEARLYKTGDLGRWLENGTIEFLGRNDDQVKIRGYRIELGEIEALLVQHPRVREAAVVAREDIPGDKRLVAYVTARDGTPQLDELRQHLERSLPDFMRPAAFVVLESLPLTPSGKLDRRALPEPVLASAAVDESDGPRGRIEETVARIWQDILHVPGVRRGDDFFELGGHSLLAMQLVSRIRQEFSIDMPIRQLFENSALISQARTVEQALLSQADVPGEVPLEAVSREQPLPLSHAQQRMLFLDEYMK